MSLFAICQKGKHKGLASRLIGGHAVIVRGHPGNTFDLDLRIAR